MLKLLLRSVWGFIPIFLIIVTLSFFIIRLAPGSPFSQEKPLPEVVMRNLEAKYGFDKPLLVQYFNYLKGLLRGDLGESTAYPDYGVSTYVVRGMKVSALIGSISTLLIYIFGFPLGMLAAFNRGRWLDYFIVSMALLSISVPLMVRGPLFIRLFAEQLGWLPTSGWISEGWNRMILPLITIIPTGAAYFSRTTRTTTLRVINEDYVRTARAKGLSNAQVAFRHVLPGAFLPLVPFLGATFASTFAGSFLLEQIFRIPGAGTLTVNASRNRDYFLLLGMLVVYAVLLLIANALSDLVYRAIDPRVTYETKK